MNQERFEFLAKKLRSREPAISAARLVLVHAVSAADAVRQTGIRQPSLSRSVKAFRDLDAEIQRHYGPPKVGCD